MSNGRSEVTAAVSLRGECQVPVLALRAAMKLETLSVARVALLAS